MSLIDSYIFIGDELRLFINELLSKLAEDEGSQTLYWIDKLEGLERSKDKGNIVWKYTNLEWTEIFKTPLKNN